jgi:hypothetical protein
MSGVRQTSIESYKLTQPILGKKQTEMHEFFLQHPTIKFTDKNLAYNLKWTINTVTPRRGELLNMGLIEEAGVIFDHATKRPVTTWRLKR